MGIIVPRPAMRHAEERTIRRNLEAHAARMKELIATGMGVTEASKQALQDILAKPPAAPKPVYVPVVCVNTLSKTCKWEGSRSIKTVENLKPCPKCGGKVLVKAVAAGDVPYA